MSTKVYNGVKFKSGDISRIMKNLLSLREKSEDVASNILNNISRIEWYLKLSDIDIDTVTIDDVWCKLKDDSRLPYKKYYVPDIDFTIMVYPYKKDEIYGCWFGDAEYYKLLKPYVTDFHYQNQSDPPENIADSEWEYREKVWDEMVDFRFSDSGLLFNVISLDNIDFISNNNKVFRSFKNTLECIGIKK